MASTTEETATTLPELTASQAEDCNPCVRRGLAKSSSRPVHGSVDADRLALGSQGHRVLEHVANLVRAGLVTDGPAIDNLLDRLLIPTSYSSYYAYECARRHIRTMATGYVAYLSTFRPLILEVETTLYRSMYASEFVPQLRLCLVGRPDVVLEFDDHYLVLDHKSSHALPSPAHLAMSPTTYIYNRVVEKLVARSNRPDKPIRIAQWLPATGNALVDGVTTEDPASRRVMMVFANPTGEDLGYARGVITALGSYLAGRGPASVTPGEHCCWCSVSVDCPARRARDDDDEMDAL